MPDIETIPQVQEWIQQGVLVAPSTATDVGVKTESIPTQDFDTAIKAISDIELEPIADFDVKTITKTDTKTGTITGEGVTTATRIDTRVSPITGTRIDSRVNTEIQAETLTGTQILPQVKIDIETKTPTPTPPQYDDIFGEKPPDELGKYKPDYFDSFKTGGRPPFISKAAEKRKKKEEQRKAFAGGIAFRHGIGFVILKKPYYRKEDMQFFHSSHLPEGIIPTEAGEGAAYRSIQQFLADNDLPDIHIRRGIMKIDIYKPSKEPGAPGAIKFTTLQRGREDFAFDSMGGGRSAIMPDFEAPSKPTKRTLAPAQNPEGGFLL
jgi:hypothetical protein